VGRLLPQDEGDVSTAGFAVVSPIVERCQPCTTPQG
jgi:hypothetical protein